MNAKITFYSYNKESCQISEDTSLENFVISPDDDRVFWINLPDNNPAAIRKAGELFHIHALALEDIAHTVQRAKADEYEDMLYIVLRMFYLEENEILDQQVSIVVQNNVVLTFNENATGLFQNTIGTKLTAGSGNLRKRGEDFLLYSILDVIIDSYYTVLEHLGEQIEYLNKNILQYQKARHLTLLQDLKETVLYVRKNLLPVRDLINDLIHLKTDYFDKDNRYFLRDLQDHMQRNVDEINFQSEQLTALMDLYYSMQANKLNSVMRTLTGLSFVLLPLTFLASLYGMNFANIPFAASSWGFYLMTGIMIIVAIILVAFAFRRNWLSTDDFNSDKE